jgi:hypothetical protein
MQKMKDNTLFPSPILMFLGFIAYGLFFIFGANLAKRSLLELLLLGLPIFIFIGLWAKNEKIIDKRIEKEYEMIDAKVGNEIRGVAGILKWVIIAILVGAIAWWIWGALVGMSINTLLLLLILYEVSKHKE